MHSDSQNGTASNGASLIGHMQDATHNTFHTVVKYMYNMTGAFQETGKAEAVCPT